MMSIRARLHRGDERSRGSWNMRESGRKCRRIAGQMNGKVLRVLAHSGIGRWMLMILWPEAVNCSEI